MKILIADINSELTGRINRIIKRLQPDWQVVFMDSGEQCLNNLHNLYKPDIVLAGIQLRDISGFDLINRIRDDSDIPVVLLTDDYDSSIKGSG